MTYKLSISPENTVSAFDYNFFYGRTACESKHRREYTNVSKSSLKRLSSLPHGTNFEVQIALTRPHVLNTIFISRTNKVWRERRCKERKALLAKA